MDFNKNLLDRLECDGTMVGDFCFIVVLFAAMGSPLVVLYVRHVMSQRRWCNRTKHKGQGIKTLDLVNPPQGVGALADGSEVMGEQDFVDEPVSA
jgi:hypothetical protein